MNKFKIGDKVKLIKNSALSNNSINDLGIITETATYNHNNNRYKVQVENGPTSSIWSDETDLELYVEEFKLPEKWCVLRNDNNHRIINEFFNNNSTYRGNFSDKTSYVTSEHLICNRWINTTRILTPGYIEITFEQFQQYMLNSKPEIKELPFFEVLEKDANQNIISIANNEGNVFIIGDTIISTRSKLKGSNRISKIVKFKKSNISDNILAIGNHYYKTGVSINKIEHVVNIVKKDDFVLPKKWFIKRNLENYIIINDWCNNNKLGLFNEYTDKSDLIYSERTNNPYSSFARLSFSVDNSFTEITFDQFKKYVLKEEVRPMVIAQGHVDQMRLAEAGIESVVILQETLLEKAIRLYPIGTVCNNNNAAGPFYSNNFNENFTVSETPIEKPNGYIICKTLEDYRGIHRTLVCNGRFADIIEPVIEVEESLLDKAKRLYPIGTKFKRMIMSSENTIVSKNDHIFTNNDSAIMVTTGEGNGRFVYNNGVWADIIE